MRIHLADIDKTAIEITGWDDKIGLFISNDAQSIALSAPQLLSETNRSFTALYP
jgi:hypothetical protein